MSLPVAKSDTERWLLKKRRVFWMQTVSAGEQNVRYWDVQERNHSDERVWDFQVVIWVCQLGACASILFRMPAYTSVRASVSACNVCLCVCVCHCCPSVWQRDNAEPWRSRLRLLLWLLVLGLLWERWIEGNSSLWVRGLGLQTCSSPVWDFAPMPDT